MCPLVKRKLSSLGLNILVILLIQDANGSRNELYSSITSLNSLVRAEKGIVDAVHEYISSLEDRLESARTYLKDQEEILQVHEQITALKDVNPGGRSVSTSSSKTQDPLHWKQISESVSSHPLRTFRLIRRFVTNLPHFEKEIRNDYERKFLRVIEKVKRGVDFPGHSDLEAATQGILRVQDAYNFDINEFTQGSFNELKTNSSLNAADCYTIGLYSLRANIYTRAIEWLQRAYFLNQEEGDKSITSKKARDGLQEAILLHNQALLGSSQSQQSPYLYREPVEKISSIHGPVKRRTRMLDQQTHKLYQTESSFMDLINFAELCRGGQLQTAAAVKNLKCYYATQHSQNRLSPLKVEILHEDPSVLQIYDILPDELIDNILIQAEPSLSRSHVHGQAKEGRKVVSVSRTSSSTWIKNAGTIRKLQTVYKKIQSLLKLNLKPKDACEDFQVTNYAITGHYNPHQDNILSSELAPGMSVEEIKKGDRIATLMFYLSNVEQGGWTAFPRLGVVAKPVKGSAIFWFNMKRNGDPEPLSLHGGCPIVYGNKWIANQWIRSNSQMFIRKCDKTDSN